jgi:hypothetical protein
MKIKLFAKRLFQLGLIILISFIVYSNLRIKGTWIVSGQKWQEPISIINFKIFKKDEYFSLYSKKDVKDAFHFAFGDDIYNNYKVLYSKNIIPIKYISKDNIVIYDHKNELKTYLKIPDSLKFSGKIDFTNKFLEIRLNYNNQLLIDTIYSTKTIHFLKNSNYSLNKKYSEKWISDAYEIKNINGFKIILYNMNTYGILKKNKENLFLYQLKKDSIIRMSINEIIVSDKLKSEVLNKIKIDAKRVTTHN